MDLFIAGLILIAVIWGLNKYTGSSSQRKISSVIGHIDSEYNYTAYIYNPRKTDLKPAKIFEGNKIGELGYLIYSKFKDKLHIVDIYIVDNSEKAIMKIDINSDTESMIGVDDPIQGHIGFLPFSIVERLS